MRVLICGSRTFVDYYAVEDRMRKLPPGTTIVHGGARNGADDHAHFAANLLGFPQDIYRAEWDKYGKAAGPRRNRKMAESNLDLGIAFWDGISKGTANMISELVKHNVPVEIIPGNPCIT